MIPVSDRLQHRTMIVAAFTLVAFGEMCHGELPWYQRSLVGLEVGPTGAQFGYSDPNDLRYCAQFDGREIVRRTVEAHSEYLVIWVRDGDYAYYDSKLIPKAPGLGGRDPLRAAVEEATLKNLPILAYCVVQQGGHFLKAHPEWEMRDANGQPIGRFCLNSGYLDAMKAIVAEQLAYGIDGFHIDMLDQGFGPPYGCWCDSCRTQFEHEFGHPMPKGATWDSAWDDMLEFRYGSSDRFEEALAAHIKSIDPKATVDFNYHGNPPFSFEVGQRPVQHAGNADFVTGETGVWGFSALGVGLNAEFYRAATPGRPFQVAIQRGVRMYHDQTTRPLNDIRWELFTLLAHGALVTMVDKTGFDGALDPVAYHRIGAAFSEVAAKRAHFGHQPVYDVGLYFSSRTRDWIGRENPSAYFQSFQGAQKTCVLQHIQFGVLLDENVSLDALRHFPVVCLPNVAILTAREVDLLSKFVEQGGRLIITGQSGQFDRLGQALAESLLSELIGANVVRRLESVDNWYRLGASEKRGRGDRSPPGRAESKVQAEGEKPEPSLATALSSELPPGWPFLVKGPATVYEPTTAEALGELLKPHRTTRQRLGKEGTDWPMSADVPVGPAILVNRFGKGTVVTFAGSPDYAAASEHHIVEARKLFRAAVRFLQPTPRVEISGPANVEAVVTENPTTSTLRIHFIAYNPTPQTTPPQNRPYILPGLIEDTPVFRVALNLAKEPKRIETANPTTILTRNERRVEATVEDIHEVIVLRY